MISDEKDEDQKEKIRERGGCGHQLPNSAN